MTVPKIIKVLMVDDNELLRRGLRAAMEIYEDISVVGEGGTGKQAIELCRELLPDVVLMDMKMPVMDGIEATRIIHQEFPSIGVVILTNSLETQLEETALQAGAKGYLLKNVTLDEVANALRAAAR